MSTDGGVFNAVVGVCVLVFVGRVGIRFVPNGMMTGSVFAGEGLICNVGSCRGRVAIEPALVPGVIERVGASAT